MGRVREEGFGKGIGNEPESCQTVLHGVQTPQSDRLKTGTLTRECETTLARFERFETSLKRWVRGMVQGYQGSALGVVVTFPMV